MISKRDVQLGKIALKAGFISKDQLTKCLALKKKLVKEKGKNPALGALLLKKGYLTKEQLEECVALHNKALTAGEASEEGPAVGEKAAGEKTKTRSSKRTSRRVEAADEDKKAAEKKAKDEAKAKRRSKAAEGADEGDEAATATATKTRTKDGGTKDRAREGGERRSKDEGDADQSDETAAKSRRSRSQRTSKDAARSRRSARESASQSGVVDASDVAEAPKKRDKRRSKTSTRARADESDIGAEVESAVDAVDPAIFTSAQEDDQETETRRLIACPDCGKRYRVKRNQTGKRFSCRRCKHRIKVPKDLFERPSELRPAEEVDEVVESGSGSGEAVIEEVVVQPAKAPTKAMGTRKKASVADAAAAAAAAVQKVGEGEVSIAELAMQATKARPKPLAPAKKFGLAQLATMLVMGALLAGFVYGGYFFFVLRPAAEKAAKDAKLLEEQFGKYKGPLDAALAQAAEALERKDPKGLGNAVQSIQNVRSTTKRQVLNRDTLLARGDDYEQKLGIDDKLRDFRIAQGKLYLERGGPINMSEGLRALELTLDLPGTGDDIRLLVARTRIAQGRYAEAAKGLSSQSSAGARALCGLAWELGGAADKAEQSYKAMSEPLAKVLIARAWLASGSPERAIQEAQGASGLDGLAQTAAQLVEAAACERKGDAKGASSAYDLAVASGKDSPIPLVARGEFLLRQNKPDAALKDADDARARATTARGLVLRGDALLRQLKVDEALASYREAAAAPERPPEALLAGEVDALAEAYAPDYRVAARCRSARVLAAEGKLAEAQDEVNAGVNQNPFDPQGLATLAWIGLLQSAQGTDTYLDRALDLCKHVAKKGERVPSRATAYVLLVHGAERLSKSRYEEALESLDLVEKLDGELTAPSNALAGQALEGKALRSKAQRRYALAAEAERADAAQALLRERLAGVDADKLAAFERGVLGVLARNPYSALAYLARSRARLKGDKPEGALADASKAIELNPHLREAYVARAFLYLRDLPQSQWDTDKGGKDITEALALEGAGGQANILLGKALFHWRKGNPAPAQSAIDDCLRQDPDFALAYKLRAEIYEQLGNAAEAQKARERYEKLKGSQG
ncbi:MAG: tetratricopeptide repeat protein [Planctomycetota bacterium]